MFDGNLWSAPWAEYGNALPDTIGCSRRMFEPLLRKLVASACLNVEYVHGTVVEYLLGHDRTIRAVVVRNAEGATYELECTLVAGGCLPRPRSATCSSLTDCTGVTQAGLKLLSRALPQQLPLGLREQYNPQMNYTSLDFPCPPGFDDFLRTLNISRTDGGAIAIERTTPLFMYFPDPAREYRSIAILRRENGGGASRCFSSVQGCSPAHSSGALWRRVGERDAGNPLGAARVRGQAAFPGSHSRARLRHP